jgi:hypothetical protein
MKEGNEVKQPEYIAQFLTAEQYSPDDWKAVSPTMKVTNDTTIGEIRQWMTSRRAALEREFKVIMIEQGSPTPSKVV